MRIDYAWIRRRKACAFGRTWFKRQYGTKRQVLVARVMNDLYNDGNLDGADPLIWVVTQALNDKNQLKLMYHLLKEAHEDFKSSYDVPEVLPALKTVGDVIRGRQAWFGVGYWKEKIALIRANSSEDMMGEPGFPEFIGALSLTLDHLAQKTIKEVAESKVSNCFCVIQRCFDVSFQMGSDYSVGREFLRYAKYLIRNQDKEARDGAGKKKGQPA